nr:LPS export ABC transporter periplasmic protein LptC [Desulfuromonadales bacterium]NIR33037.1 LPS export ABC transporter periplasmic protein LptC [Desulfuromonadales bacterium]NIS43056.1 LPS export ABC transporter periplasmic protein LptC [Desulfuromonadales bacterium]
MAAKKFIRNALAVLIVAGAVALAFSVFRGVDENRRGEPIQEPEPPPESDVSLKKVRYTETSEGKRKWTLVADGVEYWRDSETSRLENIEITFYRRESGGDVLLTARKGKFHLDSREVELWDDVELQTGDGMTFRSERAFYSEQSRRISSPGKVHLASAGFDVDAVGMNYH